MIEIKKQQHNSVWVKASSQKELGNTFIRFQEHYECPSPEFKNKIFTIGQIRNWYSIKYGADYYQEHWSGFNFPSKILKPFRQGLFDPLTKEEKKLLDLLKYRNDDFYIIGAQDQATLRHELSHALYNFNSKYASQINKIISENKNRLKTVSKYILEKGYHVDVLYDELQAYITDNEDDFIISNTPKDIFTKIIKIYEKYNESFEQDES